LSVSLVFSCAASPTAPIIYPENYTTLFYIAFIPDFCYSRYPLLKEKERFQEKRKQLLFSFWAIGVSPPMYRKVVIGL
jgi:hypothetical protein